MQSRQGKTPYQEARSFYQGTFQGVEQGLQKVEQELKALIKSNHELNRVYQIITSVQGVGSVTAIYLMVLTEGFKKLNDPRKLACYAGIAPFPYTSGTSLKGRSKVSPFAHKELKALLHMCAIALLRTDHALTDFYNKKKQEGKHAMSILNAMRNKILHTICACVRKNQKYQRNYVNALAKP